MYARRPSQVRPRKSDLKSFPAPIAGWICNRALATPQGAQGAAVLDNYFPRASTVKLRRGRARYATLAETALDVTALFSYRNGNNERLFGANESTIYDLTSVPAPYGFEISTQNDDEIVTEDDETIGLLSTEGLEVLGGLNGGDWSVVQFATTGGVYLIGVNGRDVGFIFDGSDFYPYVDGGVYRLNYDNETVSFTEGETVTGGTSGATATIWRVVDEGAGAGHLLLTGVASGPFADGETITDGDGGSADVDGSEVIATPGPTFPGGLTTADMAFVWVYKNRLWFIQKDSLNAWYMEDVDAIGGDVVMLPLAGVVDQGGSLLFGQGWSLGTSEQGGLSEQVIFITTEGQIAVYQGSNPGTADDWSKVGVYRVGTPLGRRAFLRGGGDIAIATSVGLVPLSKAIELDVTSLNVATVSYPITDAWDTATSLRGESGWQCELWPEQKMAIVAPPDMVGSYEPVLFVSNTETGAWCRFTGWHVTCMEVFQGRLYFGSTEGRVFLANATGADDGETYTGVVIPLFEDMGNPGAMKIAKTVRAVSRANDRVNVQCTISVDFDEVAPAAPDATLIEGVGLWGEAVWGQAVWGGSGTPSVLNQGWLSAGGAGSTLAPCYQITSGSIGPIDDDLIRIDLTYSMAEIVT